MFRRRQRNNPKQRVYRRRADDTMARMKKNKKTSNGRQDTTQNTTCWTTRTPLKSEDELRFIPEIIGSAYLKAQEKFEDTKGVNGWSTVNTMTIKKIYTPHQKLRNTYIILLIFFVLKLNLLFFVVVTILFFHLFLIDHIILSSILNR